MQKANYQPELSVLSFNTSPTHLAQIRHYDKLRIYPLQHAQAFDSKKDSPSPEHLSETSGDEALSRFAEGILAPH